MINKTQFFAQDNGIGNSSGEPNLKRDTKETPLHSQLSIGAKAIVSFVTGILAFFVFLYLAISLVSQPFLLRHLGYYLVILFVMSGLSIVIGILEKSSIKKGQSSNAGRGIAVMGIWLGIISIVLSVLAYIALLFMIIL